MTLWVIKNSRLHLPSILSECAHITAVLSRVNINEDTEEGPALFHP